MKFSLDECDTLPLSSPVIARSRKNGSFWAQLAVRRSHRRIKSSPPKSGPLQNSRPLSSGAATLSESSGCAYFPVISRVRPHRRETIVVFVARKPEPMHSVLKLLMGLKDMAVASSFKHRNWFDFRNGPDRLRPGRHNLAVCRTSNLVHCIKKWKYQRTLSKSKHKVCAVIVNQIT